MEVIKIKNFSKKYKDLLACDDINLSIESGIIYGFVGKNGAGKSTLIRSMVNMITPSKGSIEILGFNSIKDSKKIKEHLSYMPSEINFNERIRVKDILNLVTSFTNNKDKIKELAEYFELDINKMVNELSLGNKKKVLILISFLKDKEIYLLDEPTSGLDPLMQDKFFKMLLKKKEEGKTIFLSSHNLSEIEKYANKVAIINKGKIVEEVVLDNLNRNKKLVSLETDSHEKKSFIYEGDINKLISDLHSYNLINIEIKNASIEEEFKSYYED